MDLNNNARARHTVFMQYVLNRMGIKNNTGQRIKLLTRLGGSRSLDGMIFDIGNGKVAKCVFVGRGAVNNMNTVRREYQITKLMSDAGLGPKVYSIKEFKLPGNLLNLKKKAGTWPNNNRVKNAMINYYIKNQGYNRNYVTWYTQNKLPEYKKRKAFTFNLFQGWFNNKNTVYNQVKTGAVIIMENLYKGPGIKTAMSLYEYVSKGNKFPLKQVLKSMEQMHALNIAHGDFHTGNVMVQIKTDGSIRIVIIDFGQSKYPASNLAKGANKIRIMRGVKVKSSTKPISSHPLSPNKPTGIMRFFKRFGRKKV